MTEVSTLARGLQILNILAEARDGLSITELAERFDVDKGNMSRFSADAGELRVRRKGRAIAAATIWAHRSCGSAAAC